MTNDELACLTLGRLRGMNGVTQRELSFIMLLRGLSDPRIAGLREMPQSFSIKLHSETQVSGCLGMSGGGSPRHAQQGRLEEFGLWHAQLMPKSGGGVIII